MATPLAFCCDAVIGVIITAPLWCDFSNQQNSCELWISSPRREKKWFPRSRAVMAHWRHPATFINHSRKRTQGNTRTRTHTVDACAHTRIHSAGVYSGTLVDKLILCRRKWRKCFLQDIIVLPWKTFLRTNKINVCFKWRTVRWTIQNMQVRQIRSCICMRHTGWYNM